MRQEKSLKFEKVENMVIADKFSDVCRNSYLINNMSIQL